MSGFVFVIRARDRFKRVSRTRLCPVSCVCVIDSREFGDLEPHHMLRRVAHELLLPFIVGVFGDHLAGHLRVLLVSSRMDSEKLDLFVVEAVGAGATHGYVLPSSGTPWFH